jgi:hypothetical protein
MFLMMSANTSPPLCLTAQRPWLQEGEESFVRQANILKNHGAAVVVMAFDEKGQAATYEDKVGACWAWHRETIGIPAGPVSLLIAAGVFLTHFPDPQHSGCALSLSDHLSPPCGLLPD